MNARLSNPLYLARIVAFKVASSVYMLLLPMYWHGVSFGVGFWGGEGCWGVGEDMREMRGRGDDGVGEEKGER